MDSAQWMERLSLILVIKNMREMLLRCVLICPKAWQRFQKWWGTCNQVSMRQNAKVDMMNEREQEKSSWRKGLLNYLHKRDEYFPYLELNGMDCVSNGNPGREDYRSQVCRESLDHWGSDGSIKVRRWCCVSFVGNDALNVTTQSQYNQGEFIGGFWAINTDEQHSIYFYPLNKTWRESHSDNSSAMEQWKNKNLEKDIRNVLMVDFSCCLNKSSPHFREMPSK